MKKSALFALSLILTFSLGAAAEVKRVDDGGQEIVIADHIQEGEAGIILFYASWDAPSTERMSEMENWSSNHSDLNVVFIDITDLSSQVCQQFGIDAIPSMIVLDTNHEQTGKTVKYIEALEQVLQYAGLM